MHAAVKPRHKNNAHSMSFVCARLPAHCTMSCVLRSSIYIVCSSIKAYTRTYFANAFVDYYTTFYDQICCDAIKCTRTRIHMRHIHSKCYETHGQSSWEYHNSTTFTMAMAGQSYSICNVYPSPAEQREYFRSTLLQLVARSCVRESAEITNCARNI